MFKFKQQKKQVKHPSPTLNKSINFFLAFLLFLNYQTANSQTPETTNCIQPFSDIKIGHSNFRAIQYLKENNIIQGYDNNLFKHSQPINRAEALKIITTAIKFNSYSQVAPPLADREQLTSSNEIDLPFTDLDQNAWYIPYLKTALSQKIIQGYPDNTFRPENHITRAEALKLLFSQSGLPTINSPETQVSDISQQDWHFPFFQTAINNGTIFTDRDGKIFPNEILTRSQFSGLVYQFISSIEHKKRFGRATFYSPPWEKTATPDDIKNLYSTAHLTLPFGTKLKVNSLTSCNSTTVFVKDRGPFVKGVVLDLTKTAFSDLSSPSTGVINIEYSVTE